jgi:murein DD-endopeptidase MepM/ murein hydrolase activator NlpD
MYPLIEQFGISSPYGERPGGFHAGVDIPCPIGTPIPSPIDGIVQFEGYINAAVAGFSKEIICIIQGSGYFIVMGHLSQTLVNQGQQVSRGDIVARSGNSGYVLPKPTPQNPTAGQHLHIERRNGTKDKNKGLSAYPAQDITPLLQAYGAEGGVDDMTIEDYVADIFDVIEDDPHYSDRRSKEFKAHVDYVRGLDWAGRRAWVKDIMRYNGVLNATYMRQHLEADKAAATKLSDQERKDLEAGRSFRELVKGVK